MELDEFVSKSLVQIAKAINQAKYDASHLIAIAPGAIDGVATPTTVTIEFDVAITADRSRQSDDARDKGGNLGIKVLAADVKLGARWFSRSLERTGSQRVSRVRFSVPVNLHAWFQADEAILPDTQRKAEAGKRRAQKRKEILGE